jgi:hypothetical protein
MVRHVRVRLVNGLCHGFTDASGLIGFANFVGIALIFHVGAVIGRR